MSDNHAHDVSSHIKLYLIIGAALLVGTAATVWASYVKWSSDIQLGIVVGITVAVIIATIKGSLVAGYFMHLKDERKLIYGVLALTGAFIVVMIGLLLFACGDQQSLRDDNGLRHGAFNVPEKHVVVHHAEAQPEGEHVP